MPDKTIKCVQCCAEFVFTAGEQKYYAEREFAQPKRCKTCREARKANLEAPAPREGAARRGSR